MLNKLVVIIISVLFSFTIAFAHSGRTNSSGCHNDHKRGTYHCHKSYEVKNKQFSKKIKIKNLKKKK